MPKTVAFAPEVVCILYAIMPECACNQYSTRCSNNAHKYVVIQWAG